MPSSSSLPRLPRNRHGRCSGFTLLEVVVVILIMVVLITIVGSVSTSTSKALGLTTGGDNVYNKLVEIQQTAISRNTDVEIRFYQYVEEYGIGGNHVRAIGFLMENDAGTMEPISPPLVLEAPIIITGDSGLSTLVNQSSSPTTEPGSPLATTVRYTGYRYRSDGSTDLPSAAGSDTWHLTIVDENTYVPGATPANFYTIKLDPFTGRLTRYRPN